MENTLHSTDLHVSTVFGDNMVLQRDKPVRIWGWSDKEGQTITAEFRGKTATATVKNGEFDLYLPELSLSTTPETLVIYSESGSRQEFHDVLTGDVWFGIGQSNMEGGPVGSFPVDETDLLRMVCNSGADLEGQDITKERTEPANYETSRWTSPNKDYIQHFSEISYYFAKELVNGTKNQIPIGLVMLAVSGTPLCYFMPSDLARELGYTDEKVGQNYNILIAPYNKMTIKGIVWYQGGSDTGNYENYPDHYKRMMDVYMERFDQHGFPIYICEKPTIYLNIHDVTPPKEGWQFLPFGNIRTRFSTIADMIPNVQISAASDLWHDEYEWNNLHPYCRQYFGKRAGKIALAKEYGVGAIEAAQGPMVTSVRYDANDENSVIITFSYIGEGLKLAGRSSVVGFDLYEDSAQQTAIPVVSAYLVAKDKVKVTGAAKPNWVRFSGRDDASYPITANLSNSYGIPAVAFAKPVNGTETVETSISAPAEEVVTVYEAEDAAVYQKTGTWEANGAVEKRKNSRALGAHYMANWLVPAADTSLTFTVQAPKAGEYRLELRLYTNYDVADYPAADIPRIYINGAGESKTEGVTPIEVKFTPILDGFVQTDPMIVTLKEGENTVTFGGGKARDMGVDALLVTETK